MKHQQPDPNACPHCGHAGTILEVALRHTWQPVTLAYDKQGVAVPVDYGRFETADETEQERYECVDCYSEWPSLAHLAQAQRIVVALTDWRDHHETRAERVAVLAAAGRRVAADQEIGEHEAAALAYAHALNILRGNGEA